MCLQTRATCCGFGSLCFRGNSRRSRCSSSRLSGARRSRNLQSAPSFACKRWSYCSGDKSGNRASTRRSGHCSNRFRCMTGSPSLSRRRWPRSLMNLKWSGNPAGSTRLSYWKRGGSCSRNYHPSLRHYAGPSHYKGSSRSPCNFSLAWSYTARRCGRRSSNRSQNFRYTMRKISLETSTPRMYFPMAGVAARQSPQATPAIA